MPKLANLTVLLTVFNGADHIERTITSFEEMDAALSEGLISHQVDVVIVDDGSNDGSGQALRDALSGIGAVSRLQYKRLPRSGRAKALNVGLNLCETDLLAIHDVDDTFYPHRFDDALNFFSNHSFDLFVPGGNVYNIENEAIRRVRFANPPSEFRELSIVICPHTFWTWNRKSLAAMSGYSEAQDRLIDFEVFLRAKRLGLDIQYADRPAGRHYKYDSFFARKSYLESQKEFRRLLMMHFRETKCIRSKGLALVAFGLRSVIAKLRRGRDA